MKTRSRWAIHWGITALLLWAGFINSLQAQMVTGLNRDSLQQLLRNMPADTNKVMAHITLGQQYENNRPVITRAMPCRCGLHRPIVQIITIR